MANFSVSQFVLLTILSRGLSLSINDVLGIGYLRQATQQPEPQIVEVIRWRQTACVIAAPGVLPCSVSLNNLQASTQGTHGSYSNSHQYGNKNVDEDDGYVKNLNDDELEPSRFDSSAEVEDTYAERSLRSVSNRTPKLFSPRIVRSVKLENLGSSSLGQPTIPRRKRYLRLGPGLMRNSAKRQTVYVTKVVDSPIVATLVATTCVPDIGVPSCDEIAASYPSQLNPGYTSGGYPAYANTQQSAGYYNNQQTTASPNIFDNIQDFINRPDVVQTGQSPDVKPVIVVQPTSPPGLFDGINAFLMPNGTWFFNQQNQDNSQSGPHFPELPPPPPFPELPPPPPFPELPPPPPFPELPPPPPLPELPPPPQFPQLPPLPQFPQLPPLPQFPQLPPLPQFPQLPPLPQFPQLPPLPPFPQLPPLPPFPQLPPLPQLPQLPQFPQMPSLQEILWRPENDISGDHNSFNVYNLTGNNQPGYGPATQAPGFFGGLFASPTRPEGVDSWTTTTTTTQAPSILDGISNIFRPTNRPLVIETPDQRPVVVEKPVYVVEQPVIPNILDIFHDPNRPIKVNSSQPPEFIKDPVYVLQRPAPNQIFGIGVPDFNIFGSSTTSSPPAGPTYQIIREPVHQSNYGASPPDSVILVPNPNLPQFPHPPSVVVTDTSLPQNGDYTKSTGAGSSTGYGAATTTPSTSSYDVTSAPYSSNSVDQTYLDETAAAIAETDSGTNGGSPDGSYTEIIVNVEDEKVTEIEAVSTTGSGHEQEEDISDTSILAESEANHELINGINGPVPQEPIE